MTHTTVMAGIILFITRSKPHHSQRYKWGNSPYMRYEKKQI